MQWHTLVIGIGLSLISIFVLIKQRHELHVNWLIFTLSAALSLVQGRPEIQAVYLEVGRAGPGLVAHALPLFVIIYLVFGRFDLPSVPLTWAGTYSCLMVTDLSFNYFQWRKGEYELAFLMSGIGGAGWMDGLVILPFAAAATTLYARWGIRRGHDFKLMIGRRSFLNAQKSNR